MGESAGRGRRRRAAAALAAAVLAAGCVPGPALTVEGYHRHVEQSATALLSAVRTGTLVARLAEDDRAFSTTLDTAVSGAEDDARSVADTFASRQPPTPGEDAVRDRLTGLAENAGDGLADLRIALRRGDDASARRAAGDLADTAQSLEAVLAAEARR
ncbi:hypothetical protein ACFPZ0_04940 [Streptomonospora nanhaiensis]|uniref:Uncharacterized protein n=1 Tax=Streptomonospora nanhaiensis TaxID=1323731 RepID=A0A853BQP6_9ACTN|nr:hypothetical protein [Streptomonospora nanhaiensis]MBV2363994.1 hypothetical protein [Streptomonospora nanhaiensis]MBX9387338.1 hypothetical protein [Streptomonospora nanhaiensis]NYI96996.1 hypothetical protein [Streptomonospora nanhaiensis]